MRRLDASTDGQALRSLYALNRGPHRCLQAVGTECGLLTVIVGSEVGLLAANVGQNGTCLRVQG
jgi:hypothetical protein